MIRVKTGIAGLNNQVEEKPLKIQRNVNLREKLRELEDKSSKPNMWIKESLGEKRTPISVALIKKY